MPKKANTIKLQGKDYAQVAERIRLFREACPNGSIRTTPTIDGDQIMFTAEIVKDGSVENSGLATGSAVGEKKGAKAFEKLETIAVGRALAFLGYGASGDIASGEEMEEFNEYQDNKKAEMLEDGKDKLKAVKTMEELKTVWSALPILAKKELADLKDEVKDKLATKVIKGEKDGKDGKDE